MIIHYIHYSETRNVSDDQSKRMSKSGLRFCQASDQLLRSFCCCAIFNATTTRPAQHRNRILLSQSYYHRKNSTNSFIQLYSYDIDKNDISPRDSSDVDDSGQFLDPASERRELGHSKHAD